MNHPFAGTLKSARGFRRLSLKQTARTSNVSASSIHKYEHGKREPSITNAIRLAKAYEMNLADLFPPELVD